MSRNIILAIALMAVAGPAFADQKPVTVDTFVRAESDRYLAKNAAEAGGIGKLMHVRTPASIDDQTIIRLNRDTLYSFGVVDLAAGPVTVTLPNAGKRFMSLMVVNQDHYTPFVVYGHDPLKLTEKNVGSRYAFIAVRTLMDPNDPKDLAEVHKLQDGIRMTQKGVGKLELPDWNTTSLDAIRNNLLGLAKYKTDFRGAFGAKGTVDPINHLIGTAAGWGGNPDKDASYVGFNPPDASGKTIYRLQVPKDVPVGSFWSVSVYNAKGFFEKNPYNAYSVNDITAKKNQDGSVTVQFGGCDGKIPNCLPTMEGWNSLVRMYRPKPAVLDGKWKFPEPQPVR